MTARNSGRKTGLMANLVEPIPRASDTNRPDGSAETDAKGAVFNPEIHQHTIDQNGTPSPMRGKTGKFLLRKKRDRINSARRRPLGRENLAPEKDETGGLEDHISRVAAPPAPIGDDEFKAAAGVVVKMIEGAAVMMLSPDCRMDAETKVEMMGAYTAYFRSKGVISVPPSFLVLSSTLIYLAKSLGESPAAQSKLKRGFGWLAARAGRLRVPGKKAAAAVTTYEPTGADGTNLADDTGTAQNANP